jgi:hypothetical protein
MQNRGMTALFAALAVLTPTDDVWVYHFAQDQTSDPYLRCWGADGASVGPRGVQLTFSYSLLKFDVPKELATADVTGAKLTVWHVAEAGFDETTAKASPLEARAVDGSFEEENWTFEEFGRCFPVAGPKGLFGSGWTAPPVNDAPFAIEIDLTTGEADIKKAVASGTVTIALTSAIDPSGASENNIYKLYSRSAKEEVRPVLTLTTAR